ncbi:kinase-like domain-containing protein [Xylaria sp. FL0043]|nr:kinase-like domain-containing protein [Xylaria sp. FL0043]
MDLSVEAKTIFEVHSDNIFIEHPHHQHFLVSDERPNYGTDVWDCQSAYSTQQTQESDERATPAPEDPPLRRFLRVTTDHEPKSTALGFLFGCGADVCDILIATHWHSGASKKHFALQIEWPSGHPTLMFKNISRHGTRVESVNWLKYTIKRQRAIAEDDREFEAHIGAIDMRIRFPDHREHEVQWLENWSDYCRRYSSQVPGLNSLKLKSETTITSNPLEQVYYFGNKLGSGGFGTVRRVVHRFSGKHYAAKEYFTKEKLRSGKDTEVPSRKEIDLPFLKKLSHDSIVKFYDFIDSPPALIMELVAGVSLNYSHNESAVEGLELQHLAWILSDTLAYLHDKGIIHRDLKPSNIMVSARRPIRVKLVDFGLATDTEQSVRTFAGTPAYFAPELASRRYTNKVDIWSLGVIMLELLGQLPEDSSQWQEYLVEEYVPSQSLWKSFDNDTVEAFIYWLLQLDPDQRPSAAECRDMPFPLSRYVIERSDTFASPPRRSTGGLRLAGQKYIPSDVSGETTILNTVHEDNTTTQSTTHEEGNSLQNAESGGGKTLRPTDVGVQHTIIKVSPARPARSPLGTSSRKRPASTEYSIVRQPRTGFCLNAPTPKGGLSSRDFEDFEIAPEDLAILLELPSPTQPRSPSPSPSPYVKHYPTPKGSASYQEWQRQKDEEENEATQGKLLE